MEYHIRVYDNFHFPDDTDYDEVGNYATYEEAVAGAMAAVDRSLEFQWKLGITPAALLDLFDDFGDSPSIVPEDGSGQERFSARSYAASSVDEICKKLTQQNYGAQSSYQETIKFATAKHMIDPKPVPGTDLPYVVHLSNVAMEVMIANSFTPNFNVGLAVQAALLHDTIEDTKTSFTDLKNEFGVSVACAVAALTKNKALPDEEQMADSLRRIKEQPHEVWAVKLADRITNLQPPPYYWDNAKKLKYQMEAQTILDALGAGNEYLALRLRSKIIEYNEYIIIKN